MKKNPIKWNKLYKKLCKRWNINNLEQWNCFKKTWRIKLIDIGKLSLTKKEFKLIMKVNKQISKMECW